MPLNENPTLDEFLNWWEPVLLWVAQKVYDLTRSELIRRAFEKTPLANAHFPSQTFWVEDTCNPWHPGFWELHNIHATSPDGQNTIFVIHTARQAAMSVVKEVAVPDWKWVRHGNSPNHIWEKQNLIETDKRVLFAVYAQLQELKAQIDSHPELQTSLQREIDETVYT